MVFLLGFNPLHCGAVVASKLGIIPAVIPGVCFNPLHCGAVVASAFPLEEEKMNLLVSIPFIAGQWSLRAADAAIDASAVLFQSPSLRGSGRFVLVLVAGLCLYLFQSPSLRGSGRFLAGGAFCCSFFGFQSPSLRGSGRFSISTRSPIDDVVFMFQSPSLRGSGRFFSLGRSAQA